MKSSAYTLSYARRLDEQDPLKSFRRRFYIPRGTIYMDGNSLGLCSREAERSLNRVLKEWRRLGIRGWLEARSPWFYMAEKMGEQAAFLVGAEADEVVATGTTTVNIHSLLATFFRPRGSRVRILADCLNFPTDLYALRSQLELRGFPPQRHLLLAGSSDGRTLDEKAIVAMMDDSICLVYLPSVLYRSGQLLDIEYLTRKAHEKGILAGFDCCHSVGAVPHRFDQWGVDFAVWCSYKYLNAGPGGSAFLYVNRSHFNLRPGLAGWFGYRKDRQFDMSLDFENEPKAGGWQISSPGILGSATLEGALHLIRQAGIDRIREKSLRMTSYLIELVDHELAQPPFSFSVGTPRAPERRGGHVALERATEAWRICCALKARGIIPDFRPPNVIRIAPVALYNTFSEVWQVVRSIRRIVKEREYEHFPVERQPIS